MYIQHSIVYHQNNGKVNTSPVAIYSLYIL